MARRILTRDEILERLRANIRNRTPIIGAGSSCGLIARCAERGGADLIIVYSTGLSRLKGLPTARLGDNNGMTLAMAEEILNVVDSTPVIGGLEASDPRYWDLSYLIDKFMSVGYSGLIAFPSVTVYERGTLWREALEDRGMGIARDVEMIELAHKAGIFSMAYAYNPDEVPKLVEAGLDCLVPHVGGTTGGDVGVKRALSQEEAAKLTQKMIDKATIVNPDIICLSHGGPYAKPEDTEYLYAHSDAVGHVGASSIERTPVEEAVTNVVEKFKSYTPRLHGSAGSS